jgi:MGT family glycosyltransferase
VITLPEKGHYFPLLGPAAALAQMGYEVIFTAPADIRAELAGSGVEKIVLPDGAQPISQELRGAALDKTLRDPVRLRSWIGELLVEGTLAMVEPMRAVLRDVRPDVVAIDTMFDAGALAAELERIPWVGFATSLNPVLPDDLDSELLRTTRALESRRRAHFSQHGFASAFRSADILSPRGTAVFSTEALVGAPPTGVSLVGPSVRSSSLGAVDLDFAEGRPLIYASFGSQAWHQPRRYELLIEAAAQLDAALLIAMGDLAEEFTQRALPPRVRCVPFADQPAILRHARVAVTHGGANSVMEALTQGVPMLISPLCNDQPHNLHFVARAGAGRGVALDHASRGETLSALRELLGDGPERSAAARIAQSYRERSGNEGAALLAARGA